MKRLLIAIWLSAGCGFTPAAEKRLDFINTAVGETPKGFRSAVTGEGQPGTWKVIMDEVPPTLTPLTANAPAVTRQAVLAQTASDATDEHFPLLIFEEEKFGDFTLTVRFKTVAGATEQMAGIAFRIQDEKNYYVVRASSLGNSFRFYKFVNGIRSAPIGPEIPIPRNQWQTLGVDCKGNRIRCLLNGKELIPALTDNSFGQGLIGFWTKSDSVSYFTDVHIAYTPIEIMATVLVRELMGRYPRLLGLRLYATTAARPDLHVVASSNPAEVGEVATQIEKDVLTNENVGYGKSAEFVLVTLPVRDRNGEAVAAMRVTLKPFAGQTRDNAIARATPIVKSVEQRIRSGRELTQ